MALNDEAPIVADTAAAWRRFEASVPNPLLRALTSAFALVAAADGELARSEIERFGAFLREQSLPLAHMRAARIEAAFGVALDAILSDPSKGRRCALRTIAAASQTDLERKIVLAVAELAAQADARTVQREVDTLADIRKALGFAPRAQAAQEPTRNR